MSSPIHGGAVDRRTFVANAAALAAASVVPATVCVAPATATPSAMRDAIAAVTRGAPLNPGRVAIDIAPLVENGNTVPCTVMVESPMTAADHVKAIHLFNEKNPQPHVFTATLGPKSGRASVAIRIRLSDTQNVVAVAEMSDGTFYSHSVQVIITLGACLEDLI